MKAKSLNHLLAFTAAGVLVCGAVSASAQETTAPQLAYGVPQILQMSQAKVGDDTIVAYIKNSGSSYGLNADQIIYLKQQGVSDAVLTAMLSQPKPGVAPATPTTPAPEQTTAPTATAVPTPTPAPTVTYIQTPPATTYYYYQPYYYPYYYYPAYYPVYYGYPGVSFYYGWGGHYHGGYYYGGWHGGYGGWHGGYTGWNGGYGGWHH